MTASSVSGTGQGSADNTSRAINLKMAFDRYMSVNSYVSVKTIVSESTLSNTDTVILADATNNSFVIHLQSIPNKIYIIKRINSGSNTVTIRPTSGLIDGDNELVLTAQFVSVSIIYNGNWYII
jgi:hypothetical protein